MPLDGKRLPPWNPCAFCPSISVVLGCVESGISTKSGNSESAGSRDPN
jgi:hypothetical protein